MRILLTLLRCKHLPGLQVSFLLCTTGDSLNETTAFLADCRLAARASPVQILRSAFETCNANLQQPTTKCIQNATSVVTTLGNKSDQWYFCLVYRACWVAQIEMILLDKDSITSRWLWIHRAFLVLHPLSLPSSFFSEERNPIYILFYKRNSKILCWSVQKQMPLSSVGQTYR